MFNKIKSVQDNLSAKDDEVQRIYGDGVVNGFSDQ